MLYNNLVIGGVLVHADRKNHKYIQKVKTKSGKWRYIYKDVTNRLAADRQAAINKKHFDNYFNANSVLSYYPMARYNIDKVLDQYKDLTLFEVPHYYKWADKQLEREKDYYTKQADSAEKLMNNTAQKYKEHKRAARNTESTWRRQEMEDRRSKSDTAKKQKSMSIRDEMLKLKKHKKKH